MIAINDPKIQRIALSCIIAVLGGLLTPKAATHSLDRALLVWLVFIMSSGLILEGAKKTNILSVILTALPVAFFYVLTLIVFFIITYFGGAVTGFVGPTMTLGGIELSGKQVLEKLTPLFILLTIDFFGSIFLISLVALSGELIMKGLNQLFKAGPEAIERTRKILLGMSALVGALIMLWGAFG